MRITKKQIKKMDKYNKIENLTEELKNLLIKNDYFKDVTIYYNNKAVRYDYENGNYEDIIILKNVDSKKIFEFGNHETIIIGFEGKLYKAINYPDKRADYSIVEEMEKLFEKYGYYSELGYSYSLSLYQIEKVS
ncbi:hypothetical protein [Clostridium perfringens]|uniref:hypothetical protein n=1 Tax=Clostridium perfringens TaxID=1502 RepID=UPI0024BCE136|nr:hypothetical protein [Clostridium perfringens]